MPEVTLVRAGPLLRAVDGDGRTVGERRLAESTDAAAEVSERIDLSPEPLRRWVEGLAGANPMRVADPGLADLVSPRRVELLRSAKLREVRERSWSVSADERGFLLTVARRRLESALNSPDEILMSLAREEQRVERVRQREENAARSWSITGSAVLSEYAREAAQLRSGLERYHSAILWRLEEQVRQTVPNLGKVVGAVTAARLVAAAGGREPLGRMSAGRLQLLGARRRPGPGRNPRFGAIYLGDRMTEVPARGVGAYARSLAALAAIAARADAVTGRSIATELVRRRDRRVERLRRTRA